MQDSLKSGSVVTQCLHLHEHHSVDGICGALVAHNDNMIAASCAKIGHIFPAYLSSLHVALISDRFQSKTVCNRNMPLVNDHACLEQDSSSTCFLAKTLLYLVC